MEGPVESTKDIMFRPWTAGWLDTDAERAMDPLARVFLTVPAFLAVPVDLALATEAVLLSVFERDSVPVGFPGVGVAAPDRGALVMVL